METKGEAGSSSAPPGPSHLSPFGDFLPPEDKVQAPGCSAPGLSQATPFLLLQGEPDARVALRSPASPSVLKHGSNLFPVRSNTRGSPRRLNFHCHREGAKGRGPQELGVG